MTPLNWPNAITLCRLCLLFPYIGCLLRVHTGEAMFRNWAIALWAIMSVSDALDGFLARRFHQTTSLGQMLDPLADKLLILGSLFLLATDPLAVPGFALPNWVPAVAAGKDVLTVAGVAWIRSRAGRMAAQPRILGKASTVLQLLLIGVVLLAPDLVGIIPAMEDVLWTGCWIATVAAAAAWVDYAVIGSRILADTVENGLGSNLK